jgi:hypothetical protein
LAAAAVAGMALSAARLLRVLHERAPIFSYAAASATPDRGVLRVLVAKREPASHAWLVFQRAVANKNIQFAAVDLILLLYPWLLRGLEFGVVIRAPGLRLQLPAHADVVATGRVLAARHQRTESS